MRFDVRAKLAWLAAITVAVMCLNDPRWILLLLMVVLAWLFLRRLALGGLWSIFKLLVPVFILVFFCNGFTIPPDRFLDPDNLRVVLSLGPLEFTRGGLLAGACFVARMATMVVTSYGLWVSTDPDEVLDLTLAMRAPYAVNVLLITALATIPGLQARSGQIRQAAQARGVPPFKGPFAQLRSMVPLMIPLIITSLRTADDMAIALTTRGYGAKGAMTQMRQLRLRPSDWISITLAAGFALGIIALRLTTSFGRL